jgi:protein-S-isoprenylcysteine O-methyltransferase Ste14
LLLLFFAAPFERTYIWGGEAPRWISGLALALELVGLWLALGARIQLGFFSWEKRNGIEKHVLVRRGFYRFIRHPVYAGVYLALIAWPIAYGAPISAVLTVVIVGMVTGRLIGREEKVLIERYGDEYRKYQDESDAMIPNLW